MIDIMQEWEQVIKQYAVARNQFEQATEVDDVDSAVYMMQALESKISSLDKQIRRIRK